MKRRYVATGLVAGLVAGTGAGLVLEQSGRAGAASAVIDQSVSATDDTAATDGTAATGEAGGRAERLVAALQPLIDDGTITQVQADAVIAALADAGPWHGRHSRGAWRFAHRVETITTALGITAAELLDELAAGSTLREVATAAGVDPLLVVDAIVADAKAHLDEEVAEGDLTQGQADAALAEVTTRASDLLDATGLPRGFGHGGRGPGHHGRPDDDDPIEPTTTGSGTAETGTTGTGTAETGTAATGTTGTGTADTGSVAES